MIRLCELRTKARQPLTKLLHEAVSAYYELLTKAVVAEGHEAQRLCCAAPRLEWRGTVQNAAICCGSCGFVLADEGQLADWHDPEQTAWQVELEQQKNEENEIVREPST